MVSSFSGFKKTLFEDLKCPRDLKEGDFLDMIKSTFPQLAGDKPLNIFKSDHSKRLQRLMLKTLTPEDIYRTTKPTGLEKAVLYVKLKVDTRVVFLTAATDIVIVMKSLLTGKTLKEK